MEKLTREELKNLTNKEVELACERIKRDHYFGRLNDRVTPVENAELLEQELQERKAATGN